MNSAQKLRRVALLSAFFFVLFSESVAGIAADDDGAGLVFSAEGSPIVRYNYKPFLGTELENSDKPPVYRLRSGNLHPIWSPKGAVLTEIFPESHAHHLGVWGAWVKARYQGQEYDFWNLKAADAAELIRYKDFESKTVSGFQAKHLYLFKMDGEWTEVMQEKLTVDVSLEADYHVIDTVLQQTWQMEDPLELLQHRYGGAFAWRYPSTWTDASVLVVNSEGGEQRATEREGVDAARARWLKVHGEQDGQIAGFLILSHPTNFRHPEPVRVLHDAPGRGGYVHFTPIRESSWILRQGETQTFRYRVYTYDGLLTEAEAEHLWRAYAGANE